MVKSSSTPGWFYVKTKSPEAGEVAPEPGAQEDDLTHAGWLWATARSPDVASGFGSQKVPHLLVKKDFGGV